MTATKTRTKKASDTIKISALYSAVASQKSIDTTRAAKLVRSRLRSNFAKVCEVSPNVAKAKSSANDGNRWPAEVSRDVADVIGVTIA